MVTVSLIGSGLCAAGPALAAQSAAGEQTSPPVAIGRVSPPAGGAVRLGPAPTAARVQFDVVLKPRDPSTLSGFATAVSTPGSPLYRHFLRQGTLARAFGPTAATIASVRTALTDAGFTPGRLSANGLLVPVTTTVGRAEAGLHTRMASYRLRSGRDAMANTDAPRLPSSIASDVQAIVGLNTATQAQPESLSSPVRGTGHPAAAVVAGASSGAGVAPCNDASRAATYFKSYTGDELAQAYGFDDLYSAGDLGAGATVALFELEPFEASDISSFQACYGTNVPVTTDTVDGGAGTGPGSGEAALDIENVIELAPGAHIDVYEAPNTAKGIIDDYNKIASTDTAQVVSTSWGLCEAFAGGSTSAESTIFEEMVAQGQTVFAASGDSGSEGCEPKYQSGYYSMSTGTDPVAAAADPGTGTVYVANRGSGDVSVESESQLAPVSSATVDSDPDGVAVDPGTHDVYVADGTSPGSISVIPGATCDAVDQSDCAATTIAGLGDGPAGIAVDATDGTLYVADEGSGTVSVVSEASGTVVGTVALGSGTSPDGVAVDTATHDVYVTDSGSDTVSVIDGARCNAAAQAGCGATPSTIVVGTGPEGVVVDPATDTVYVADTPESAMSVIDGSSGTVSATFNTEVSSASPSLPIGIALSPSGKQVLVTGYAPFAGTCVTVISPASHSATAFLATGDDPVAIAVDPSTGYAFTADSTAGYHGRGDLAVMPLFLDVDDPASQPDVTGVGGTDLTALAGPTESAWGAQVGITLGASGGGISSFFPMPSYQSDIVSGQSSGKPCGAVSGSDCRQVPDVSASADPNNGYVIFYQGQWAAFGGTSGAAPLWAALAALAVTRNGTVQRLGNIDPDLYQFAEDGYPDFNDVTTGDNDFTTTSGGAYGAAPGYDMATGLGSPNGSALAANLDPFAVTAEPMSQTVAAGQTVSFTVATIGTPAPTMQWEDSTDGGTTFTSIPGATSDTYDFTTSAADNDEEFEVAMTNPSGSVTTAPATLHVFSITTTSLPEVTDGVPYSVQLEATGGTAPYAWTHNGALPKGLTLTSSGLLSGELQGKKIEPHTFTITVKASIRKAKGHTKLAVRQKLTLTVL